MMLLHLALSLLLLAFSGPAWVEPHRASSSASHDSLWTKASFRGNASDLRRQLKSGLMNPEDYCDGMLAIMSRAVAAFEECALVKARPILMCMRCQAEMEGVRTAYGSMTEKLDAGDGGNCAQKYSEKDTLNIFPIMVDRLLGKNGLWSLAKCETCYEGDNSTLGVPKNTTRQMVTLYYATIDCFKQEFGMNENGKYKSPENQTACVRCHSKFNETMHFYHNYILPKGQKTNRTANLCMDLRDMFNVTTIIWNEQLVCHQDWVLPWYHLLVPLSLVLLYILFMFQYAFKGLILGYEKPHPYNIRVLLHGAPVPDGEQEQQHHEHGE